MEYLQVRGFASARVSELHLNTQYSKNQHHASKGTFKRVPAIASVMQALCGSSQVSQCWLASEGPSPPVLIKTDTPVRPGHQFQVVVGVRGCF